MKKMYYSHGKLLLTGEYFVLDGAQALAVPCKFGQTLEVETNTKEGIDWSSYDKEGRLWFQQHFSTDTIKQTPKEKPDSIESTLQKILHHAFLQNPSFFKGIAVSCKTTLEFPRDWGLGSSSTLIYNLAQWTSVDAYKLLEHSFGGSGYDIAAAQSQNALIYTRYATPRTEEIILDWDFTDQIFFVHQNQKQDSKEGIAHYRAKVNNSNNKKDLSTVNSFTKEFIHAKSLDDLAKAINKHESFIAAKIGLKPIQESLFPDYPYAIKSLGAWGGDFFMALGEEQDKEYFKNKGHSTIVSYADMVLKRQ